MNTLRSARFVKFASGACLIVAAATASGCNNAGEGALSGAGIGALGGLAIGSLYGDAGKGAVLGTVAGALFGGVVGDQNRRNSEYHYRSDYHYHNGCR